MNEEELKKGCGKEFYTHDRIILVKCGTECKHDKRKSNQIHLCTTCQARLEGFQKGKLEERERIRDFIIEVKNSYEIKSRYGEKAVINICAYLEEQLKKGIDSHPEEDKVGIANRKDNLAYKKSSGSGKKEIGGMK